jgi:hypothetical protein
MPCTASSGDCARHTHTTTRRHKKGTLSRKDLDTAINLAEVEAEWFPENPYDCAQSLNLNKHLGAEGAMSPGRVQDPEGAKMIAISFNTAAGAVAAIVKTQVSYNLLHGARHRPPTTRRSANNRRHNGCKEGSQKDPHLRQRHAPTLQPRPK